MIQISINIFLAIILLGNVFAQQNGICNKAVQIASGNFHSLNLVLKADGSVWSWTKEKSLPAQFTSISNVKMITVGGALKKDGTVWTLGEESPKQVAGLSEITMLAEGSHSLALKNDGTVWAWGRNNHGQLGDGTTTDRSSPIQVSGISNITMIAAKAFHSLALKDDGTVWAWGKNYFGQLGDGTRTDRTFPVQVNGLFNIVTLTTGDYHSLALKDDGTVWAWGNNFFGALGNDTYKASTSTIPVQVIGLSNVSTLVAGSSSVGSFSLALKKKWYCLGMGM